MEVALDDIGHWTGVALVQGSAVMMFAGAVVRKGVRTHWKTERKRG